MFRAVNYRYIAAATRPQPAGVDVVCWTTQLIPYTTSTQMMEAVEHRLGRPRIAGRQAVWAHMSEVSCRREHSRWRSPVSASSGARRSTSLRSDAAVSAMTASSRLRLSRTASTWQRPRGHSTLEQAQDGPIWQTVLRQVAAVQGNSTSTGLVHSQLDATTRQVATVSGDLTCVLVAFPLCLSC